MRKGLAVCVGSVAAMALLLGGCANEEKLRFCERENRMIPDAELKGRLLLDIRNNRSSWGKIPDYIEIYLAERLPVNATDAQVENALADYAARNPLCCQFVGRSNLIDEMYEGKMPYKYRKTNYFSDIYIFKNERDFGPMPLSVREGAYTVIGRSAAFSCGEAFVYNFG